MFEALDEFVGFFHDRDVGREVRIKYRVEAQAAQRRVQLPCQVGTGFITKLFANRHAYRRGNLRHSVIALAPQKLPHLLCFVGFNDRPGRAVRRTLAAHHARRIGKQYITRGRHARLNTAAKKRERVNVLQVLADVNAATALDALVEVEHQRACRGIFRQPGEHMLPLVFANTKVCGQCLQLAALVAPARQARIRVRRENELEHGFTDFGNFAVMRRDAHALFDRRGAGARQIVHAVNAHDAQTTGAVRHQVGMFAQCRNIHLHRVRRIEQRAAGFD